MSSKGENRFQNNDMGNHRIVVGVGVLGNIQVLLYDSSRI